MRAYIGHGAGHSQLDKLKEAFGTEVEGFGIRWTRRPPS